MDSFANHPDYINCLRHKWKTAKYCYFCLEILPSVIANLAFDYWRPHSNESIGLSGVYLMIFAFEQSFIALMGLRHDVFAGSAADSDSDGRINSKEIARFMNKILPHVTNLVFTMCFVRRHNLCCLNYCAEYILSMNGTNDDTLVDPSSGAVFHRAHAQTEPLPPQAP